MEILEIKTQWGKTEQVQLEINSYMNNGCLYIGLNTCSEYPEPYCDITVNLDGKTPDYCGYVDLNKMPELEQFLEENKIGEFTGLIKRSGFCEYSLYLFDPEKLRKLCPDGMKMYEQEIGALKDQDRKEKARHMVIEINKDIDKYQESVALGLSAKQLIFSAASLISGAGVVLLLYRYIGLTGSAYVAVPVVAPIALGGFYSYNGMSFYDLIGRKLHMMFGNKALVYISTESEAIIDEHQMKEQSKPIPFISLHGKKAEPQEEQGKKENTEDFEAVRKKMQKVIIGSIVIAVMAVVATILVKILL